ncbi:hypothetical protein [Aeromonas veronii]|uniref:hypothetical protein n=1 Tax=Aeromonas veronii TaxID=654 RepID=UPI003BA02BBF
MSTFSKLYATYLTNNKVQQYINQQRLKDPNASETINSHDVARYYTDVVLLVCIQFKTGTLMLCNSPHGDIQYNGTYLSDGTLSDFKNVEESTELNTRGVTIELRDYSRSIISIVNRQEHIRAPVSCYLAYMGLDKTVPDLVVPFYEGYIDKPTIENDNNSKNMTKVTFTTINILSRLSDNNCQRTAHALHQAVHPDDDFYKFSSSTQDMRKKKWKKPG